MPYSLLNVGGNKYSVVNTSTGKIHSKHTTLAKAQAQIRLLHGVEAGSLKPRKK